MSAASSSSSTVDAITIGMSANGVWIWGEPSLETCRQLLEADRVETMTVNFEPVLRPTPAKDLVAFLPAGLEFHLERWESLADGACRAVYRRVRS